MLHYILKNTNTIIIVICRQYYRTKKEESYQACMHKSGNEGKLLNLVNYQNKINNR